MMKIVNSRMTNPSIELNRAAKDKFCVSVKISRYHLIPLPVSAVVITVVYIIAVDKD